MTLPRGAADKIRERVDRGVLPSAWAARMFGGPGTGHPCSGCDVFIGPSEVEYEFEDGNGRTIRFDSVCSFLWGAELRRRGRIRVPSQPAP